MINYNDEKFREGYKTGEYERVALATANSELRSQILKMKQQHEEMKTMLHKFALMLDHKVFAHDDFMWCEMKTELLNEYNQIKDKL